MSPYVRNLTIVAAVLFIGGAYFIMTNVDPNAGLNRQPVKPAVKPVEPVAKQKIPPPAIKIDAGVVATFEGGKFGKSKESTETPTFTVDHDWSFEVETKGEFSQLGTSPQDLEKAPKVKPANEGEDALGKLQELMSGEGLARSFSTFDPPNAFRKDMTIGGKYRIWFHGNGVWRVTIRQGTGKLPQ